MEDLTFITREHPREMENQAIGFEFFADRLDATEFKRRLINEDEVLITGRTLTIQNPAKFLQSMDVKSRNHFEEKMQDLADREVLSLDYLHRRCERHGLEYSFSGERLHTAWRKYLKENSLVKTEEDTFKEEFMEFYENFDIEHITDLDKALEMGIKATERHIPEGCSLLTLLYHAGRITDSRQRIRILIALS